MERVKIFDVEVMAGSREELFMKVANMLGEGGAVSTVNPEILYDSLKNEQLREALQASVCIPDGVGVERTIRKKGVFSERFPGVELGEALVSAFPLKLGIIGGAEGVARRAVDNLCLKHPTLTAVFALPGYNINEDEVECELKEKEPDLVFVCLGSPKQEIFIRKIKQWSPKTLFIALGGSVDIYAGDKRRAPKIIRRMRGEWIYRIVTEPKRIKRFPKLVLYAHKSRKSAKNHQKNGKIGKKGAKRA